MKRVFYVVIFLLISSHIFGQIKSDTNHLSGKKEEIVFKIFLKDGGIFHGKTKNKRIFIVTEFARIKLRLGEVDSVEIGILPDYYKEKKILKLIKKLNSANGEEQESAYKKLTGLNIGALPVIRNYIKGDTVHSPQSTVQSKYNIEEVLKELETKYKVNKDFIERDIIYMHSGFKMGGIFTIKKKRAFIKFGRFVFQREEMRKIEIRN